jgi:hypothetical protein
MNAPVHYPNVKINYDEIELPNEILKATESTTNEICL